MNVAANRYHLAPGTSPAARQLMETISSEASALVRFDGAEEDLSPALGEVRVNPDHVGYVGEMSYAPESAVPVHRHGLLGRLFGAAITHHKAPPAFLPTSLNLVKWSEERYSVRQLDTDAGPVYQIGRRFWGQAQEMTYDPRSGMCSEPIVSHHRLQL